MNAPAGRIVLVRPPGQSMADVVAVLESLNAAVELRDRFTAEHLSPDTLVLVWYDGLSDDEYAALVAVARAPVQPHLVMLTRGGRDLKPLFEVGGMRNLVACEAKDPGSDLRITVNKLLTGDLFGLDKYFDPGVPMVRLTLERSGARSVALEAAERLATQSGAAKRLTGHFALVADEFFTNALFNAPVDGEGKWLYRHLNRSAEVALPAGKSVDVCLACDGRRLGISTLDRYGSLTADLVIRYLAKCFRKDERQIDQKEGGAGLGFYMVFESLTHFAINISPRHRTEMIGLIDVRGTYREFARRTKSFNIFIDG
jgi:hypothetical protein